MLENMIAVEERLQLLSKCNDEGCGILGPVRRKLRRKKNDTIHPATSHLPAIQLLSIITVNSFSFSSHLITLVEMARVEAVRGKLVREGCARASSC